MRTSLVGLCAFGLLACGGSAPKPFRFGPSSTTPAAIGEVATAVGPNGNTKLTISVKHLAPPERVAPGATVYVVWASELERGSTPHNLGALRVDADLNGQLESTTPMRSFDVAITPEPTANVSSPGDTAVLTTRIVPRS
jgi:hypothetical protein